MPIEVGADAPDFTLKSRSGENLRLAEQRGNIVLVNFWASWRLPSEAELSSIQSLYDTYGDRVDFYIITDEEREPVETFMEKQGFTFPLTYLIIGEPSPLEIEEPPYSYLIDKNGYVVIEKDGIANWDSKKVHETIDELLTQ